MSFVTVNLQTLKNDIMHILNRTGINRSFHVIIADEIVNAARAQPKSDVTIIAVDSDKLNEHITAILATFGKKLPTDLHEPIKKQIIKKITVK